MRIWRNLVDLDPSTERLVERDQDSDPNDDMAIKNIANERQDVGYYFRTQQQARSQPPHVDQRPTIDWESFLSVRSLIVLLVENDDSTRHAVGALIRNCSYEVIAVSNGLEAWKILKDVTNRVDIVLTELETPCLSGFDLLSKITSNKTRKNIPVIMMSSNDSMNIVFKCLSNGAVDFLVKPIRKNELKNLWQHVWRKCHRSKSEEGSNNNYEKKSNNGSPGLTFRNASDNDSITKSACSKRAQPTSQMDDLENLLEVDEHVAMGKDLTLWTLPALEQLKDMKKDKKKLGKEMVVEDNTVTTNSDTKLKAKNATNSCEEIVRIELVIDHPSSKVIDLESYDEKEPSLELNLQRVRDVGSSSRTTTAQTRDILRRSDHSAFYRYNTILTNKQTLPLNIGSCSSFNHTLEKGKTESMQHLQPEINPTPNQTDKPESSLNGKQIPIVTLDSDGSSLGDINDEEAPYFGPFNKLGKGILGNAPKYESASVSVGGRNVGCDDNTLGFIGRNRIALREAALNRFRQKRKKRCFKKKVSTRHGALF